MDNNRQRKQKNPTEKIKSKLSTNLMETIVEEENTKELGNNFPSNQFEKNEDQIQISNIPANKIFIIEKNAKDFKLSMSKKLKAVF